MLAPMPRVSDAYLRAQIPTALVIGGGQDLLRRCQAASMDAGIVVKACPVSMAAALAEERRPLVIVVTESAYALDPDGFDAIARSVLGTLLRVDREVTERELEVMLSAAVRESRKHRMWHQAPGRYSVVPAEEGVAAPRAERWGLPAVPADTPGREREPSPPSSHRAPLSSTPRVERWQGPSEASSASVRNPDAPPPSSRRVPPSSRRAQFHVELDRLFDERGLPRAE
jgi:hypothetical protein